MELKRLISSDDTQSYWLLDDENKPLAWINYIPSRQLVQFLPEEGSLNVLTQEKRDHFRHEVEAKGMQFSDLTELEEKEERIHHEKHTNKRTIKDR